MQGKRLWQIPPEHALLEVLFGGDNGLEIDYESVRQCLTSILTSLTPREDKIIRMRFGLGGDSAHTLEAVGQAFTVGRERIRQIEAKVLRKLRHPSRAIPIKFAALGMNYEFFRQQLLELVTEKHRALYPNCPMFHPTPAPQVNGGSPDPDKTPIENLELSVRAYNCLKNARINTIGDLATKSQKELLKSCYFGRKSVEEIKTLLAERGIELRKE